ncbi:MAG: MOSC domain-containing protein [Chloroflexi bacterium HGW-Chloroflexi-10]|nr:MAG: MOSC domain-containing protein [Chloroflexi bacterium HGW-Chloroflexi-10]
MEPHVLAVHTSPTHTFSKRTSDTIILLAGLGVEGDAHCGKTVKHQSRVARDPSQPNLRQVHLIQAELFDSLAKIGHNVLPGQVGENITTRGIDLLDLPTDTELLIGPDVVLRITGLRNPCKQLDNFQPGLMAAVLERTLEGNIVRKAGVMAVVISGGKVTVDDPIRVMFPSGPFSPLEPV